MIRLGYINYLNSQPLYEGLEHPDLELVKGNPQQLANLFYNKQIDFGQMSVYEFLQNQDKYFALKQFCISSSQDKIPSVLLLTQKSLPELDKAEIILTDQSITSVQLLKILLEQKYKIKPLWLKASIKQLENNKNYLLIGDNALKAWQQKIDNKLNNWKFYDLVNLWSDWTNLPFVFALFVGRRDTKMPEQIQELLENNLQKNLNEIDKIIKNNLSQNYSQKLLKEYFTLLDYKLDERKIISLQKFCALVGFDAKRIVLF